MINRPLWTAVGEGCQANLQALYALVLRRSCTTLSPSIGESFRAAYATLRRALTGQLREVTEPDFITALPLPALLGLRVRLATVLRGHALRCYSNVLSDAAAQLSKPAFRRTQRNMEPLAHTLEETLQLLDACHGMLAPRFSDGCSPQERNALADALHNELLASAVLEHWSRLLLLLTTCELGMHKARRLLCLMSYSLPGLVGLLREEARENRRPDLLAGQPCFSYLLASYVVGLCSALDGGPTYGMPRQSPLTDGEPRGASAPSQGPTRGPSVAPLFTVRGQPLLPDAGNDPSIELVKVTLLVWEDAISNHQDGRAAVAGAAGASAWLSLGRSAGGTAQAATAEQQRAPAAAAARARLRQVAVAPYNTSAVVAVCMRVAAVAAASLLAGLKDCTSRAATAAARPAAVAAVLERTRRLGLGTPLSNEPSLARLAFACAHRAIYSSSTTAADGREAKLAQRLGRYWAAMTAYVDAAAAAVAEGSSLPLVVVGRLLAVPAPPALSYGLPPGPAAGVAAAVAAGYVPSLTRAVLAMDDSGTPPWKSVLADPDDRNWAWAQLLAFGSPTEMAALLASFTQMLSRAVSQAPARYDPACPDVSLSVTQVDVEDEEHPALEALCYALEAMTSLHSAAIEEWIDTVRARPESVDVAGRAIAGAEAADDVPEGLPRLSLMMSYLAVHLLPAVADALLRCVLPAGGNGDRLLDGGKVEVRICDGVTALLSWVVVLLGVTQVQQPEGADGAAARLGDPPRLPRSSAAAAWRELLLCKLHVPELLGVAIRVATGSYDESVDEYRADRLAWTLLTLLVFVPVELVAALTSPRAALAAHLADSIAPDGQDPFTPLQPPPTSAGGGLHQVLKVHLLKSFGSRGSLPRPRLMKLLNAVCSGSITPEAAAAEAAKLQDNSFEDNSWWRGAALIVPATRLHQLLPAP